MNLTKLEGGDMPLVMMFIEGLMADIDQINERLKDLFKFRFISDQDIKDMILILEKSREEGQDFLAQMSETSYQKTA